MTKKISVALAFVFLIALAACGSIQRCAEPEHRNEPACSIVNSVVDCTTANATTLIDQFEPAIVELIKAHTSADGIVDWPAIEPALSKFAIADGQCVLADVVGMLTRKSTAAGAPDRPKAESISDGFDVFRSKVSPGVKFKTRAGEI